MCMLWNTIYFIKHLVSHSAAHLITVFIHLLRIICCWSFFGCLLFFHFMFRSHTIHPNAVHVFTTKSNERYGFDYARGNSLRKNREHEGHTNTHRAHSAEIERRGDERTNEWMNEKTRHCTKSIIILVIVFGIRFALFCYLPIHSITLNFVTTTFCYWDGMVGGWCLCVFFRFIRVILTPLTIHEEPPLYSQREIHSSCSRTSIKWNRERKQQQQQSQQ